MHFIFNKYKLLFVNILNFDFSFLQPKLLLLEVLLVSQRCPCGLRHDVHVLCVLLCIEMQILIFQVVDCLKCAAHGYLKWVCLFFQSLISHMTDVCEKNTNHPQSTIIASVELWPLIFVLWAQGLDLLLADWSVCSNRYKNTRRVAWNGNDLCNSK